MDDLKSYHWEYNYNTSDNDMVEDFFYPALSRSRFYYRIAGYFSSSALCSVAKGLDAFVQNGEKIFLIIGNSLSKDDIQALERGVTDTDLLNMKWQQCLKEFEEDVQLKDSLEVLAWLMANNKLEVKIGINKDENGRLIEPSYSKFHRKIMIFEDYNGNRLHCEGSFNATKSAIEINSESLSPHFSWVHGQEPYIELAKKSFDTLWNDSDPKSAVIDIPEMMRHDLFRIGTNVNPSKFMKYKRKPSKRQLRGYQNEAIEAWKRNDYVGILEMATGSGKTFTALNAVKPLCIPGRLLVILVPQRELLMQWNKDVYELLGSDTNCMLCFSGNSDWKNHMIPFFDLIDSRFSVIISSMQSMSKNDKLIEFIAQIQDRTICIIDEVHEIGSRARSKLLTRLPDIRYRLGLSATPERMWDEEGNAALNDFFGAEPVFKFTLKDAIYPKNPKDRCLCEYNYHIHICSLNDDELELYADLTSKINSKLMMADSSKSITYIVKHDKHLERLLEARSNILKSCEGRFDSIKKIIDEHHEDLHKCIIYCNSIDEIKKITKDLMIWGYNAVQYHSRLSTEQRDNALDSFRNGSAQFIVSRSCLDQGIDIPICDSAIIASSSQNPREYVQRRGRILRLHKDKDHAEIHDILVLPYEIETIKSGDVYLTDNEKKIFYKQIDRLESFRSVSMNKSQLLLEMNRLRLMVM